MGQGGAPGSRSSGALPPLAASSALTTVDVEVLTADPAALITAQEQRRMGDVRTGAGPAQRDVVFHQLIPDVSPGAVVQAAGVDDARSHGIDADRLRAQSPS